MMPAPTPVLPADPCKNQDRNFKIFKGPRADITFPGSRRSESRMKIV